MNQFRQPAFRKGLIKLAIAVLFMLGAISQDISAASAGDQFLYHLPIHSAIDQEPEPATPAPTDEGQPDPETPPTESPTDTPPAYPTATPGEPIPETPEETPTPEPEEILPEITPTPTMEESEVGCPETHVFTVVFRVDGVRVSACTLFDAGQILQPTTEDFVQFASSLPGSGQPVLSLLAVPYGIEPATEAFPTADRGISAAYLGLLSETRRSQGAEFLEGIPLRFLGKDALNLVSLIPGSALNRPGVTAVLIAEWVTEAGGRVWLLRASADFGNTPTQNQLNEFIEQNFSGMVLSSENLEEPSRSLDLLAATRVQSAAPLPSTAGSLPSPSWWSGTCNVNNHPGSYALGSSYLGVITCGPLGTEKWVNFGEGVSQLEWQCPELVKRFLYLKYGIPPYSANGKDVVRNYSGTRLVKVANGTKGIAPRPGDVLSYGDNTTYGHTSVVSASSVDASGNGWVRIIEQNYNANGTRTHTVSNWTVIDGMVASGWLRDPLADIVPAPISPTGRTFEVNPVIQWTSVEGASTYRLQVYKDTARIISMDLEASVCADGVCTFPIETPLAFGNYSWRVRSFSAGKWNPFSAYLTFSVARPIPKTLWPAGVVFTITPVFEWSVVTGAPQYEVRISDSTGSFLELIVDAAECGTTCRLQTGDGLPYDSYRWRVRAFFNGEWQAFTAAQKFRVANPVPTPRTPTGTVYTTNPQFVWSWVPKATMYRLQIYDGDVRIFNQEISGAACDAVQCKTRSKLVLEGSNYTWRVRAYVLGEWNGFSLYLPFGYAHPSPTLLAPIGQASSIAPVFQWTPVQEATNYRLQVYRGSTKVIDQYVSDDGCSEGVCQLDPQMALNPREHKWRVRAYAGGVWRPYSAYQYFTPPQ